MFRAALAFLAISCSSYSKKEAQEPFSVEDLWVKLDKYEELLKGEQDEHGFIYTSHCDSLLFTGLLLNPGTDLSAAEEDGKWYRTPKKDCFPTGRSDSEISKDMLLGVAWWSAHTGNYATGLRTAKYLKEHSWFAGLGNPGATWVTPASPLRWIFSDLGRKAGEDIGDFKLYPWLGGLKGYQAHLEVLGILLVGDLRGQIDLATKATLRGYAEANPHNAVFQFAHHLYEDGKMDSVIEVLADEKLFPKDELPVRCQEWIWQREEWEWDDMSCKSPYKTGGEFIFIAKLLKEYVHG